jgi:hypothetical protein
MSEKDNNKSNSLEAMFKSAMEEANRADIDEPLLIWPELPEDLKTDQPKKEAPEK